MTTITEFMRQDHDEIDALFSMIADGEDQKCAFDSFAKRLKMHILWEEEILFLMFEQATGMNDTGPTAVMRDEHRQIEEFLSVIHDRLRDGERAQDLFDQLRRILGAHNDKEENILYPSIDGTSKMENRLEAVARMAAEKSRHSPGCKHGLQKGMSAWKTSIADSHRDGTTVRGYKLTDCIEKLSFAEMVLLLWTGERPSPQQARVFDAMLVACAEHGIAPPSVMAARTVFSGGNPMNAAVAAGVLACGDVHGGAIESCAKMLKENLGRKEIVDGYGEEKKRMPGYGHKVYTKDPRTAALFKIAEEQGVSGPHVRFAKDLETELEQSTGRKLCLNVDGAIAALICDMGIDWRFGKGLFALARTAGLVAHVHEEWTQEKPFRRLESCEYTGKKDKVF